MNWPMFCAYIAFSGVFFALWVAFDWLAERYGAGLVAAYALFTVLAAALLGLAA